MVKENAFTSNKISNALGGESPSNVNTENLLEGENHSLNLKIKAPVNYSWENKTIMKLS